MYSFLYSFAVYIVHITITTRSWSNIKVKSALKWLGAFDGYSRAERDYRATIHTVNWFLSFETWTSFCWIDPRWQILQLWWCNFDVKHISRFRNHGKWKWELQWLNSEWEYLFLVNPLTHWGRDEMAAILQTAFSDAFSWMKLFEFCLQFH